MRKVFLPIFFLLSMASRSQVIINPYLYSSTPSCPFALSYTTVSNLTESPSGTWCGSGGNGHGKAGVNIPSSTGASYYSTYNSSTNQSTAMVFSTSNSLSTPYYSQSATWSIYVDPGTGTYRPLENGSIDDTEVTAVAGDLYGIFRSGSTFTAQYYRSGAWHSMHTYSSTSSATIYFYMSMAADSKCIVNPLYCNSYLGAAFNMRPNIIDFASNIKMFFNKAA